MSLKRIRAKNYLLIVIPNRNIKDENLILPHINLSYLGQFQTEGAETIFEGFVWDVFDLLYLCGELQFRAKFWGEGIF